ncbi:acyltransferase family protein [Spirosoma sp.]|uniref:acyltransferase family protein n=1 Tax=Spirosoma sp. TaxID=1899569 RepID=UPI0026294CE3|nr:acyltransferase family protein [Spirosoma sp.]MCX6219059.1 acyltransferase family protein [Spirosoma sp.]
MPGKSIRIISPVSSVYLDAARLLAALVVLYVHAHDQWYGVETALLKSLAHGAVVIFFVLSGYVIAYTTTNNNRGEFQYAKARLSRLYSVLVPTLLITIVASLIVSKADPALMAEYTRGAAWPRYLLSGTFLNEIWFLSATPPINRPLWSLSYEFWYYAIFGAWFYAKGGYKSYLPFLLICMVAGPKILCMMPIWLAGVAAYKYRGPVSTSNKLFALILLLFGVVVVSVLSLPAIPYQLGRSPLYYANQFITDWISGLIFAFSLWLLPTVAQAPARPNRWIERFRDIANMTFPLYVLHHPLLILWRAVRGYQPGSLTDMWQAIVVVTLVSAVLGVLMDKQRFLWDRLFTFLLNKVKQLTIKITPSAHRAKVLVFNTVGKPAVSAQSEHDN